MSALRRIAYFHTSLGHAAKVYRDTEWNEYRVKFYDTEGQHHVHADYHTDEIDDALETARIQLQRMKAAEE